MYAEVYFSSAEDKLTCHFNHFRSRRQYIYSCLQFSQLVCYELTKTELLRPHQLYVDAKLQETGKMFVFEGGEVVSHCNLLVFRGGNTIAESDLDIQSRRLLMAFLKIQHSAWLGLCRLCESFFSVHRGYYVWQGNEIELLELGDALWIAGNVRPVAGGKTKRLYFKHLFGFFNLPVPDNPCHRLGEIGLRSRPDSFLSRLCEKYLVHWEDKEA